MSSENDQHESQSQDARLYRPLHEDCEPRIKSGWDREFCCHKNPGEDYFHMLVGGELYIQRGDEKYCLSCAIRLGILTTDRLHWQKDSREPKAPAS